MKVYLSTTSKNLPKARALMQQIRDDGHTITFDWTEGFEGEPDMTRQELAERAQDDIEGVYNSDLFILYMQPKMVLRMTGAAVELGAALALGIQVWVVEQEAEFTHFFKNHPGIARAASLDVALDYVGYTEER